MNGLRRPHGIRRTQAAGWHAWCAVTALAVLPAVGVGAWESATRWGPISGWTWETAAAQTHPWTWWAHAWVHLSPTHLLANLSGLMIVLGLAREARVTNGDALAWSLAWGLGPVLLPALGTPLAEPVALTSRSGASGLLHAAVFIVAARLLRAAERRPRLVGAVLTALLAVQVARPDLPGLAWMDEAWGFAVAHAAHRAGVLAAAIALASLGLAEALARHGPRWQEPSQARQMGRTGPTRHDRQSGQNPPHEPSH